MVSTSGWLKLYRQVIQSSVWTNSDRLKMWILVLTQAAFADGITQKVNGIKVKVNRGEWATNRRTAAQLFNYDCKPEQQISESTAYRILIQLKSDSMVNIKSTNKYSVIKVINYDTFQFGEQLGDSNAMETRQKSDNFLKNLRTKESITTTTTVDPVIEFWEKNGFGMMSPKTSEDLNYWIQDFKDIGASETDAEKLLIKAMASAVDNTVRTYPYVNAILKDWENKNFKTVDQVEAYEAQRAAKKQGGRPINSKPAADVYHDQEITNDDLPF